MKKTLKQTAAGLLAAVTLALSFSGCGGKGTPASANSLQNSGVAAPTDGEVVKLRVWGFGVSATSEDEALVSEAVSAITREKIGVEVEFARESDKDKLILAMNSGEQWDLVNYHTFPGGLSALVANGMAMPIDELAAEYGQDALKVVGEEMLAAGRINGVLYSLPNIDMWANSYGMAIRADILEELDIDPESLKTWDDVHEALLKMKEAYPDKYPVLPSWAGGGMEKTFAWDNLGSGFWDGLGILENCHDSSTTVVNMYETDGYREICERMYQWRQEGLLMPDAITSTETTSDLLDSGIGFASFEKFAPSKQQELATGKYWGKENIGVSVEIVPAFTPSDAGGSSYFIPTVCEYPEKAMQLWNLMYSDPEIATILMWGIEGRDFEYTDDSHKSVRNLEEGSWGSIGWSWPNQTLAPVFEGMDYDIWEQNKAFRESGSFSPALGFKFDTSPVMNEITACNNVIAKYETGLRWGELNPEETLPKFNEELYAAGLQTIIDEKQKQLDAFLTQ